jgi:nucleoside-diphosphate-sugar epimerase
MNDISILGCGWLGLPLAEHLIKKGYKVKGSVTSPQKLATLEEKGIQPFLIKITDTEITGEELSGFFASEILVINFPPSRREDILTYHPAQMGLLIEAVKKSSIKHIVFVSSTSVYPDLNREVFETDDTAVPPKTSGKALLLVEEMLKKAFSTTVVRFAGLIGYDRQPGRFLAGKKEVENGDAPINVIHQDDCIAIITAIIEQQVWNETFNACSDVHPLRRIFYTKAADKIGLPLPEFKAGNQSFKIINSDRLKQRLNYSFKYPNPIDTL